MQASILFVGNHHNVILVTRHELLEELKKEGYDIIVSIPDNLPEELRDERIALVRNSISRFGTNPLSELKTVLTLRKQIRQVNPNVVVTFTIKPNLYSLIAWGRKFPCHSECYRAQCLPFQIRTCSECYLKDSEHDVQKKILYSLSSNLISC